jgi:DNA-binding NtrC family response regulator
VSQQRATSPDLALPWGRTRGASEAPCPSLVLAWSLDEPERVGEILAVRGPCCVGRGENLADDPAPRIHPMRVRPGYTIPRLPLANARISRQQLTLRPLDGGQLQVRCIGRTPMFVNGRHTSEAVVSANDLIELRNAAIFLVAERRATLAEPRSGDEPRFDFGVPDEHGIVGESELAHRLREQLAFAAGTSRHVLLLGPSGTGKELAARAIHALSERHARAFVSRNAATLPEGIVDAELFGNTRGYPNPGMAERPGLLGEAHDSTLFLDEIGDLPERLQVHLLRAMDDDGEYQRLGDARPRRSSFRLVAATNRPLSSLKHDFLARFTHRIHLPSLDERRDDLPLVMRSLLVRAAHADPGIAARFFERRAGELAEPRITPALVSRLLRHRYTHNVRELDRLLWLAIGGAQEDYLDLTPDLEAELGEPPPASPVTEASEVDVPAIERALLEASGNISAAARSLGLRNRYVLLRLLKKHGIEAAGHDPEDA